MADDSITLKQLRYLAKVAEHGSLSKVSTLFDIDQPTLSRMIRRMEKDCGWQVFYRNGRGVTLTPHGREFLDMTVAFLSKVDDLRERVNADRSSPQGSVSFAVVHHLSEKIIPQIIVEFDKTFPDIHVHLYGSDSGTIQDNIADGKIDLGIFYDAGNNSELIVDPIVNDRMYLVGLRSNAERRRIRREIASAELGSIPLALPGLHHGLRRRLESLATRYGFALHVKYEIDMLQALRSVIRMEDCFAILPHAALLETMVDPEMVCVPIVRPELDAILGLAFARGRPIGTAQRHFAQFLRAKLKDYTQHR